MSPRRKLPVHLRRFSIALFVCGIGGGLLVLLWPQLSGLYLFGLYAMPSNSMMPFPHEPGLLYFAKYYDPLWVAIAGTIGSGVVAFADYEIVERMFRLPRISATRESALYQKSVGWFLRAPFLTIVLFSFTPLPIYIVRVLAPAAGYSVWRYVTAIMIGRLPRFWCIAWLGHTFHLPTWVLIVMFFVLVGLVVVTTRRTPRSEAVAPVPPEMITSPEYAADSEPDQPAESEPLARISAGGPGSAEDSFSEALHHGKPTVG